MDIYPSSPRVFFFSSSNLSFVFLRLFCNNVLTASLLIRSHQILRLSDYHFFSFLTRVCFSLSRASFPPYPLPLPGIFYHSLNEDGESDLISTKSKRAELYIRLHTRTRRDIRKSPTVLGVEDLTVYLTR